jgi:hypothetical protein
MIKKLISRLLGKTAAPPEPAEQALKATPLGQRVELSAEQHGIDPDLLDDHAVRVVRTLKDAGFEAYVVGGAVRDLLVGRRPKDFDVATDATPEQVKALFRRAFIIGRRFRIVHVVFGRGREHEVGDERPFAQFGHDDARQAPAEFLDDAADQVVLMPLGTQQNDFPPRLKTGRARRAKPIPLTVSDPLRVRRLCVLHVVVNHKQVRTEPWNRSLDTSSKTASVGLL